MEVSRKTMSLVTILIGLLGTVFLLISLFSAPWIRGDREEISTVSRTGSPITITITSGPCSEGLFMECCHTKDLIQKQSASGGFSVSNSTSNSCFIRGGSDFHGKQKGVFRTAVTFAALALVLVLLAAILSFLLLVGKLQDRTLIPLIHMVLLYVAALFFIICLILMGAKYKAFTDLLEPTIGWSMWVGIVAQLMLLLTAIGSTVIFMGRRRSADAPYGNF